MLAVIVKRLDSVNKSLKELNMVHGLYNAAIYSFTSNLSTIAWLKSIIGIVQT